jgi:hypothetical protein
VSPGGHLVTTALACAAVQTVTGSAALTAGVAAGGFLIDLDHVLDYIVFERQRGLRPAAFLHYYLAGRTRTVVLVLHSYEILAALALIAWASSLPWLWGYVLGAAALHLPLDIVFNGKVAGRNIVPFYSLVYRARAGFRTARLLDTARLAPPPARFWSAFFVGAATRENGPRSARVTSIALLASPAAAAPPRETRPRSARVTSIALLASPAAAARPTLRAR